MRKEEESPHEQSAFLPSHNFQEFGFLQEHKAIIFVLAFTIFTLFSNLFQMRQRKEEKEEREGGDTYCQ